MDDQRVIYIVGTQCQPEHEEEFNIWYNETHIPMLLKFKGLKNVTRYKIISDREEYPKYMAVYEFPTRQLFEEYLNSPERTAALEEMRNTWSLGELEIKWQAHYELLKTWRR